MRSVKHVQRRCSSIPAASLAAIPMGADLGVSQTGPLVASLLLVATRGIMNGLGQKILDANNINLLLQLWGIT